MSIFAQTAVIYVIGPFIYLFLYWRSLRQDYSVESIFGSGIFKVFLVILFVFLSNKYLASSLEQNQIINPKGLWFWFGCLGLIFGLVYTVLYKKFKFFETLEAETPGLLIWLGLILLVQRIWAGSIYFVLTIFYYILANNYKKISWYRSGKIGFSALFTLGVFFLIRSSLAIYNPAILMLAGRMDGVLSAGFAFLCFFSIYNLSYN